MSDTISRQAAIDAIMGQPPEPHYPSWYAEQIKNLPSAQPEILACGNGELNAQPEQLERCPIYDGVCAYPSDRCYECPRHYGAQSEQRWIPFETRPLTKEEKEEHPEWDGIIDCKLPDDGQRILINVSVRGHESVQYDEFYTDDGSYLDSGYEIGTEATAWMPLPEPYMGTRSDTSDRRKD